MVTVNETAHHPPAEAPTSEDGPTVNTAGQLSLEASLVNQRLSQQVRGTGWGMQVGGDGALYVVEGPTSGDRLFHRAPEGARASQGKGLRGHTSHHAAARFTAPRPRRPPAARSAGAQGRG
jgi:hypothetical protein